MSVAGTRWAATRLRNSYSGSSFQMAGEKYEIHPGIRAVLMMGSASGHIL